MKNSSVSSLGAAWLTDFVRESGAARTRAFARAKGAGSLLASDGSTGVQPVAVRVVGDPCDEAEDESADDRRRIAARPVPAVHGVSHGRT